MRANPGAKSPPSGKARATPPAIHMADYGYHSPQFSEDIAWLPAWLQPHQLPRIGEDSEDEHAFSMVACKNQASFPENISGGQAGQLFTRDDAKFSGFRLYLSGEDNSPDGNAPSPGQELHFRLHLSSVGVSQLSSGQLNEIHQTGRCETNKDSCRKPFETSAVQYGTRNRNKLNNNAPASESIIVKDDQNDQQECQGKLYAGKLQTADINDAVELSIAASEAMVISEIMSCSSSSELLLAPAILEIALRVKQARKQCYSDITEAVSVLSNDELDETDQLCDLDECSMEEAFDDVGLSVTQIVGSLENSFYNGKSPQQLILQSRSHVSESHCECKGEAQRKQIKDQDVDINRTISQTFDVFVDESWSKNMPLEAPPLQTSSTALLPMDSITSCLRNKLMAHTQKLIQMDSKDDRGILKESEVVPKRDTSISKTTKEFCNGETSFISKSMDVVDECTLEQRPEADCEMAASSSTLYKDLSRWADKENERSTHEGIVSSQDLARYSNLSLVDPLCSVVPCSISSEDTPMKEIEENNEKFMNSDTAVRLQNLNGKTAMPNAQETLPAKTLDQGAECLFSKTSVEGSGVPSRKQFNSLKSYSMVMPCQNTTGEIVFQKESLPLLSKGEKIMHLFPTEKSSKCFAFNQDESRLPFKSTDKSMDVDGPNSSCSIGTKDHERVDGIRCRDQTTLDSGVPQVLSLRSHPKNKRRLIDKKVRFVEAKSITDRTKTDGSLQSGYQTRSQRRTRKRMKESILQYKSESGKEIYNSLGSCRVMHGKGMIFQGLEFLLTGFSSQKEKEFEAFIRKYGGYVLSNIPSFSQDLRRKRRAESQRLKLPIVLSPRKVETTKFLYGCATNTWMLNANWTVDSVQAGFLLPPRKYMTQPIQASGRNYLSIGEPTYFNNHTLIFDKVGVMLYGKASFCAKYFKIIKHGGGQVFKSLQRLIQSLKNGKNTVGALLVENEGSVSRHLKHFAFEHNLQTTPASWIINSLFSGKLLPFKRDRCALLRRIKMPTFPRAQDMDMSQEI